MNDDSEEFKNLVTDLNLVIEKVCDNIVKNNESTRQYYPIEDITYNLVFLKNSKSLVIKHLTDIDHNCYLLAEELETNHYNADLVEEVKSVGFKAFLTVRK